MVDALESAGLDPSWEQVDSERDFVARLDPGIDLILSDYSLPQYDGLAALQVVRSKGMDTPFLLVSGSIGEEIAVEAMRAGADDYLLKDRMARLGAAALQAIENRRLRREAVRSEYARRESDERFRQIAENIHEVFWLTDAAKSEMLYVSPGYELIWGRSRDALHRSPQSWIDAVHPEERDRVYRAALELQTVGRYDLEYRVVRPDGTVRWIHDRAFPVRDESGAIYRVAGVAEDITAQKQAESKIRRLNRMHAMLSGVNALIVRVRVRQSLFEDACRMAVEHGGFALAWIGVLDSGRGELVPAAVAGHGEHRFLGPVPVGDDSPTPRSLLVQAVRQRRPVYSNDITESVEDGGTLRQEAVRSGYRSTIVLPLITENAVAGIFSMLSTEPNQFDADEVALLSDLAGNISFALENMAHQEKIAKLSRVRAVSSEINAAIVRIQDRRVLLQETCRIATEQGKFELIWVGEIDTRSGTVDPVASAGFSPDAVRSVSWANINKVSGAFREAIGTRRIAVRNDIGIDLVSGQLRSEAAAAGCLSTVAIPLVEDNQVVALVCLFGHGREFFDADELALLSEVAADLSFALASLTQRARVEYLSYYDTLTGLPNRTLFMDRTAQQMRARGTEEPHIAVVLLAIERLQSVNETFGRHGGDELLKQIAHRLETTMHGKDFVARVSADHFGALFRGFKDSASIMHALESRVFECFREAFAIDGHDLIVPVKIGIALYPTDGRTPDELLNNAEAALKQARNRGELYLFYSEDMNAQAAKYLLLETKMRKALDAKQFVLHYQPKVELSGGRLHGLEALIRWQDPDAGLVSPGVFIPLLEETGLIDAVGRWAVHQALDDHCRWVAAGLKPPRIAVNVSAKQLARKDFVDFVSSALQGSGDNPDALEFEVTESILVDMQSSIRTLNVLRGMGIQIALDDFGTGYSSLSYLTRLPINSVKIDRSFISAMATSTRDMSIVTMILALAGTLSLNVVAEGVETLEQLAILQQLGCHEAQGYLLCKPVPASEIVGLLRHASPGAPWPGLPWPSMQDE